MIKPCISIKGLVNKQVQPVDTDKGLYLIPQWESLGLEVNGQLINICRQEHTEQAKSMSRDDILLHITDGIKQGIEQENSGKPARFNMLVADLLGLGNEARAAREIMFDCREKEREQNRQKELEQQAVEQQARADFLTRAIETCKADKSVTPEQFEALANNAGVAIPIKTLGWLRKSILWITSNQYQPSRNMKSKSTTIFSLYREIRAQYV